MIGSFLNYTGGKYRILRQLLPLFPKHCGTFIDLFCGSGVVSANYHGAEKYVLNDSNQPLIDLIRYIGNHSPASVEQKVDELIQQYGLSDSMSKGYSAYGADSMGGLAHFNRRGYLQLRDDYNAMADGDRKTLYLYVLIIFGFNNQIRFNRHGFFNIPVGKRDFNIQMRKKLRSFSEALDQISPKITSRDFRQVEAGAGDFVYADPPYLITTATYNENGGWDQQDDEDLFDYLDDAGRKGAKFAMSNVLEHKGRRNEALAKWGSQYNIVPIDNSFRNASYHTRRSASEEVLITNYETPEG